MESSLDQVYMEKKIFKETWD